MEWSGIEDQDTVLFLLTPSLLKPTNPGNHSLIEAIGISVLFPTAEIVSRLLPGSLTECWLMTVGLLLSRTLKQTSLGQVFPIIARGELPSGRSRSQVRSLSISIISGPPSFDQTIFPDGGATGLFPVITSITYDKLRPLWSQGAPPIRNFV